MEKPDTFQESVQEKSSISQTYSQIISPIESSNFLTVPGFQRKSWSGSRRAPVLMMTCLLAGIGLAVSHHIYYQSLNKTVVVSSTQQTWAIRFGTGFAFLVKTALGVTTVIVFTQLVWVKLRKRATSIRTIDNMFAVTTDLTALVDADLLLHAKTLATLGLAIWCLPFLATITPATLTVGLQPVQSYAIRAVPYINSSWNGPTAFWNGDTAITGKYNAPSPLVARLLTASATTLSNLPLSPPSLNSSYSLEMYGPALSCGNVTAAQQSYLNSMTSNGAIYVGTPVPIDYNAPIPTTVTPFLISIGESNLACGFYNASYKIHFDFSNGVQTSTIIERLLQDNLVNIGAFEIYSEGPNESETICLDAGYDAISPTSPCKQAIPASAPLAYMAMIQVFQELLEGTIYIDGANGPTVINSTRILVTGLASCPDFYSLLNDSISNTENPTTYIPSSCRNSSLALTMEELMTNFTLSMLSSSEMVSQSSVYEVNVTISQNFNVYVYDSQKLILTYGIVVVVTIAFVFLGAQAFHSNRTSYSSSFSSILVSTRNPDLDDLVRGHSQGSQTLEKAIMNVKLQYGSLQNDVFNGEAKGKVVFGLEGTVGGVRRGG